MEEIEQVNIEIRFSPIHRYGVFAKKDITPQKVIEECPVAFFSKLEMKSIAITDIAFIWDDNNAIIPLGYGSMYNHSAQSNAIYVCDHQNKTLNFIATKHIPAGTEILVNYGDKYWATRNKKPAEISNSCSASKVIVLLLLLLGLSKIFPINRTTNSVRINPIAISTNNTH